MWIVYKHQCACRNRECFAIHSRHAYICFMRACLGTLLLCRSFCGSNNAGSLGSASHVERASGRDIVNTILVSAAMCTMPSACDQGWSYAGAPSVRRALAQRIPHVKLQCGCVHFCRKGWKFCSIVRFVRTRLATQQSVLMECYRSVHA